MKNNNNTSREELTDLLIKLNEYVEDEDKPVVKRLIDQHTKTMCERARVDELKQLWNDTQPDIVPEGAKANDMSERLHERIAELQSSPNKREDSDE